MWRYGWLGASFISGLSASIAPGGPAQASSPAADDGAAVIGERSRGSRILDLAIRSPVLAVPARVRLLLPSGWSRDAARTWPVLWLLPGAGSGPALHTTWTDNTDVDELTAGLDIIVVMPDGGRCGNYTDWWNHGKGGPPKWETFHLAELRQILERGYRAGTARAIAGNGMGGMGALAYAARHRGLFRAAASFSGPLNTLHRDPGGLDVADLVELGVAIGSPSADWTDVWGDPDVQRVVWRQHNPYDLAERLSGVRLYISSGDGDPGPYDPQPGTDPDVLESLAHTLALEFTGKLKKLGVPVSTHFYNGTHRWPYWQRELHAALPILLAEIT
ncbi:esterase family protein [Actinomadura rudentiformis]|uniref:Esterase family protein n=2 Tax=Actinomadura rudentiformis TaxID=359158 RepID=A0A6H9YJ26_9ACTN|nr:esterase family protein [Actinomadura rudentiformis]